MADWKPPWWAYVAVVVLSPILYPLTHRNNGHSYKDYTEFLKGN